MDQERSVASERTGWSSSTSRERAGDWPAHSTVGVGDTPIDVASADAAGCRSIAVTTGKYGREELDAADAVIANLGELESALATLT
jgi:phosphoglycolate phosphatase-like HAD superfamily hydrolase